MQKLDIKPREVTGKQVKNLRKQGLVPASLYGPKYASQNKSVDLITFKRVFKEAGYSNLIDANVEGGDAEKLLLKEVQKNPVTDEVLHVSFYVTDKNTAITSEVPVNMIGMSKAEDLGVGFVINTVDTVIVKCLPGNLPDHFEVDISNLEKIGDSITIGDLKLPAGVELDTDMDPNTIIVSVVGAQKEEVIAAVVAPELDAEGNPIVAAEGEAKEGEEKAEDEEKK